VIGGELGGRRLRAPRGALTRPTSDRVREALFMALEPLAGVKVVDLFAGSGALGIEALSRGAIEVDFAEPSAAARRVLLRNLAELGIADRATVWDLSLPRGLKRLAPRLEAADLVLMDPPYGGHLARATLVALGEGMRLSPAVRVVVEHHRRDDMPEASGCLGRVRERRYGETVVTTYAIGAQHESDQGEPA
jgi:16S rRNA (guanine966-N2)-methyltransferase